MKILHLSSEKGWRGGEQQIAYLIGELDQSGVENIVVARKGSDFERYCQSNKIPVYGAAFSSSVDLRTALRVKNICRKHEIDLIHLHSAKSHSIGVLAAALGNATPIVLSRRVDFVPSSSWFTRWKYNHSSIRKIVCVSHKIDSIMRRYLKDPSKSMAIHSGVDLSKFRPIVTNKLRQEFGVPPHLTLIGNSSALEGHKDYFTFLRTIEILKKKEVPVHAFIMGSGSLDVQLRAFASERGLDTVITFTGFRKDIVEVLPCLDIFLMTSNEEGLGTSVLDAFLAKAAVVATAAGGIPEMVIHERSGLLSPVGDAESLAANVERIVSDPTLKNRLIEGALEVVKSFSKKKTAAETLKLYNEVLTEQS